MSPIASVRPAPWSPKRIATLALDLRGGRNQYQDAAGTTPSASANDVQGYWGDASGTRNPTQATTASKPVVKLLNGRLVPWFDASDDNWTFTGLNIGTAHTVFCVIKPSSVNSSQCILVGGGSTNRAVVLSSTLFVYTPPGTTQALWTHGMVVNGVYILEVVRNGTSVQLLINGVSKGTNTLDANNAPVLSQIGREGTQFPYGGYLPDLVVYTSALSSSDRLQVRRYLAALNGVTL